MSYARIDDLLPHQRPVVEAGKLGIVLLGWHAAAHCYAERHRTDGVIPSHGLTLLAPGAGRPPARVLENLQAAGLWEPLEDGAWRLRDYLEWNAPSAVRAARGRSAARVRWNAPRMRDASETHASSMCAASSEHLCLDASPQSGPNPAPEQKERSVLVTTPSGGETTGSAPGRSRDQSGSGTDEQHRRCGTCGAEWLGGPHCPKQVQHAARTGRAPTT